MISGTPYSPAKAFISFARDFFDALARDDVQAALSRLHPVWSKKKFLSQLKDFIGSEHICSFENFTRSASPILKQSESGYILYHALPVQGKWSNIKAVFEFTQKPGTGYFLVSLRGFERL